MTFKNKRAILVSMCVTIATIMVALFLTIKTNLNRSIKELTASDAYSDMHEDNF